MHSLHFSVSFLYKFFFVGVLVEDATLVAWVHISSTGATLVVRVHISSTGATLVVHTLVAEINVLSSIEYQPNLRHVTLPTA